MNEELLAILKQRYPLTECDCGEFAAMKANGMRFSIRAFDAKGLGHVSAMEAKGMFGLVRMDTLIVNPTEKDLPLYSYDRMKMFGRDILILELYQTTLAPCELQNVVAVADAYRDLGVYDPGKHWYDDLKHPACVYHQDKKTAAARMDALVKAHFAAFAASDAPACDPAEKRKKASVYVEGLLKNGGPSTDVFLKAIGPEKTGRLFRGILFGTEA